MTVALPPEWATQKAMWSGWPSHPDLWLDDLEPARREVAQMIAAVAAGQKVHVMAMGKDAVAAARNALPKHNVEIHDLKFGDIWLRDIGPIFTADGQALRFRNNGWGGKYDLPHDDTIGDDVAKAQGAKIRKYDFVLEGGAVENDGAGTILTTRECLLNANRNGWSEPAAEAALKDSLGAQKILWLERGLLNDHTDGHIDNLARFVAPAHVICQSAAGADDPNAELYEDIFRALSGMTDAQGRRLNVTQIPSPGLITDEDDEPIAASHANFLITNAAVVVPTYGTASAPAAIAGLQKLFPGRRVVGIDSHAILTGGGSFHCMTQQVPA